MLRRFVTATQQRLLELGIIVLALAVSVDAQEPKPAPAAAPSELEQLKAELAQAKLEIEQLRDAAIKTDVDYGTKLIQFAVCRDTLKKTLAAAASSTEQHAKPAEKPSVK